jgi:hypothetical protein
MSQEQQAGRMSRRRKREKNYFEMDNTPIQRPDMSMKAKGLLAYLISLPDDWTLYKSELVKHFTDGKDAVRSAFAELEKNLYIITIKSRDKKGKFVTQYMFDEIPFTPAEVEFHRGGFSDADKPPRVNRRGKSEPTKNLKTKNLKTKNLKREEEEKEDPKISNENLLEIMAAGFEEKEIDIFIEESSGLVYDIDILKMAINLSIEDFNKGFGLGNPGKWLAGKIDRLIVAKNKAAATPAPTPKPKQ